MQNIFYLQPLEILADRNHG